MFIQNTKLNNHTLISDTNTYSYYPGLIRIISENGNFEFQSYIQNGSSYIDIIQFSNNILSCQISVINDLGNLQWDVVFNKIQ